MISISIISHNQFELVKHLLDNLEKYCKETIEVLLTVNIPEILPKDFSHYTFPIRTLFNTTPKGFGANHNAAFKQITHPFFCVLNPDIRLNNNPFPHLISCLDEQKIGVITPVIIDERGSLQDNARKFLNFTELFKRIFKIPSLHNNLNYPDWIAGMFMLFRKEVYQEIEGFDEAYFLYCEDMDLCARLREKNYAVYYDDTVKVIHSAQRQSHKKIRYFIWHIQSLIRYFSRHRRKICNA